MLVRCLLHGLRYKVQGPAPAGPFCGGAMERVWYTKSDVAFILNTGEERVMALLQKYNVKPVMDFGRGRGGGLRWSREAIMGLATHLSIAVQTERAKVFKKHPQKKPKHSVTGRNANELFAELSMNCS